MKKIVSLVLTLVAIATFILPAYASSTQTTGKTLDDLKIDYETMTGHQNRSFDDLIQLGLDNGLTQDEAEYYAKMDIFANQVDCQKINIKSDIVNAKEVTQKEKRLHPDVVQEKAVDDLDPSALKTELSANDAVISGHKDAEALVSTLSDNEGSYTISCEYPDGSKCVMSGNISEVQPESADVTTNTHIPGPWTSEYQFGERDHGTSGTYCSRNYWEYKNNGSYVHVEDLYTFNYNTNPLKSTYVNDDGAATGVGVISVSNQSVANHYGSSVSDLNTWIQGYTSCTCTVSSAFQATFGSLSVGLSSSGSWNEYAVTEVNCTGRCLWYAAQFR